MRGLFLILAFALNAHAETVLMVPDDKSATTSGMTMPASYGSAADATIVTQRRPNVGGDGGVSVYYLTSRATQPMSYQTMKSMGDGGGGGDDRTALPNLNYLSASAFLPVSKHDTFSFGGLQSLDAPDSLRIATPFGADFQLPSQVALAKYRYEFSPAWAAEVRGIYINTVGARDPLFGATYTRLSVRSWTSSYQLSSSVPVTSQSHDDGLITRAVARATFTKRAAKWGFVSSLAYIRAIYDGGVPNARPRSADRQVVTIYPSDVDLILIQKEMQRARADASVAYAVTDAFTAGAGLGLSYVTTERDRVLWMTTAKPLSLKYSFGQADVGIDASLNSDIREFSAPRLPSVLTIGFRAGYTFGDRPQLPN